MAMNKLRNDSGDIIAWWFDDKSCKNKECLAAIADGRNVHLIPAHTDPRAENVYLALPHYHFRTLDESVAALEAAWSEAEIVTTFPERDAAYTKNVPVKISHNIVPASNPLVALKES